MPRPETTPQQSGTARAGEQAERWGIRNPMLMAWRSDAAMSLTALGDQRTASRLCAEEIELARQWGASRGLGIALRAAGMTEGADRGLELLTEAVSVLRPSPARLELARALIDLGAAHRRAGSRAGRVNSSARAWTSPMHWVAAPSPTGPGASSWSRAAGPAAMPRGGATH